MAKKIQHSKKPAAKAVEELDVLHPERTTQVGGKRVTVREYGGVEWLRLLPEAEPLIGSLAGLLKSDQPPTYDAALAALASNIDSLLPLVALACDEPAEFVTGLSPDELELLLMTWWGVNGRFFIGRAANRVAVSLAECRLARSAGANSTPRSSRTATSSTTSADTPVAS